MGRGFRKQTLRVISVEMLSILQDTTILQNSVEKCVSVWASFGLSFSTTHNDNEKIT
ncbi:hypothetical protein GCM10027085_02410 [Spirosoma aerophilum]